MSDSKSESSEIGKALENLTTVLVEEALKPKEPKRLNLSVKAERTKERTTIEVSDDLMRGVSSILSKLFSR